MVKIGRCSSCGSYVSEAWSMKDNCRSCGGAMDHIDVDLGPISHLPRALNIAGLLLVLISVLIFIALPASRDGSGGVMVGPLVLILGGALMFVLSLVSQMLLAGKAVQKQRTVVVIPRRAREQDIVQKKGIKVKERPSLIRSGRTGEGPPERR